MSDIRGIVNVEANVNGRVSDSGEIYGIINEAWKIDGTVGSALSVAGDVASIGGITGVVSFPSSTSPGEEYQGSYTVTPAQQTQVLPIARKTATQDITVEAIPNGYVYIPDGYALYNGYLMPKIVEIDGYPYVWIRKNDQTGKYDAVYGSSVWYSGAGATLDGWRLQFNNQSTVLSRQYSCSQENPNVWVQESSSSNYYGTTNGRKVIWTSHDILIGSASGNVLLRKGIRVSA